MGTAGAVKLAAPHLENLSDFLVMNGDSFIDLDFRQLIHFHRQHRGLVSMAVRRVQNPRRYGTVQINDYGRVTSLLEKTNLILLDS